MTTDDDLTIRVAELNDHQSERLLQEVLDQLLSQVSTLQVDNEESARELVASFLSQHGIPVHPDEILRPVAGLETYIRGTLSMLAQDPQTAGVVESALEDLPEETQMFADPVTAAVVLGVLVAFLQTKFDLRIRRKDGRVDFEFALSKKATSDKTVGKVVEAVRGATIR